MSVSTLVDAELAFIPSSGFRQAVLLDRSTGISLRAGKRFGADVITENE